MKHFLRNETSNVKCPKCEPFNVHSGSKIDKSNGTKISGKNCLFFGYTLYVRLSRSSDRNSGKMFHSGAVDGKALVYLPLEILHPGVSASNGKYHGLSKTKHLHVYQWRVSSCYQPAHSIILLIKRLKIKSIVF